MTEFDQAFLGSVFVMRHGQSQANVEHVIVSSLEQGSTAYGLTDLGTQQVQDRVQAWQAQQTFDKQGQIFCSPFLRTRETAAIASDLLGWPITVEPALRERFFGELDQRPDHTYDRIWQQDQIDPSHTLCQVESVFQVRDRVLAFFKHLSAIHEAGPVLLVTHGDTASITLTTLNQGDLRQHRRFGGLITAQIERLFRPVI